VKLSWLKSLLIGGAALLFALMSLSPGELQATTADDAYNAGYEAGAKAYDENNQDEGEEEEEEGGCCGGGGM
jgi:hypothetical protein